MKKTVGETYEFSNGTYLLVEDRILKNKEKNPFLIKLNIAAILFIVAGVFITLTLFPRNVTVEFQLGWMLLYAFILLIFVVVHELLHGISFVLFSKNKWNTMKFGVSVKSGVAYCISLVPVRIPRARLSLMMPLYAVCLPVYIYAIITGDFALAILGVFLASGSVGDIYYMWQLRNVPKTLYMYEELPTKTGYEIGFYLFEKL